MNEKPANQIKKLKTEIKSLEEEIRNCVHKFSKPKEIEIKYYDFEFSHFEGHGSDPEPVYNTITKFKPGWTRECNTCGYTETTDQTKPKISGYIPVFTN